MRRFIVTAATLAFALVGGTAYAHPKLVSANPPADGVVASPTKITLQFSEKLVPAFSKADVVMAAMPGMAAMKMASSSAVAPDGKTLVITPSSRLPRGRYTVNWNVVSGDTHKINGHLAFAVK
ncbi:MULTISPECIES: copper homeostasis periplasmic binding protein CopC [unclassified Sphingomonas]|uniref:copper homeostasis periplasmic binding protein CopC n=1 Tax=unclassified Sphingomonas TaxID=196159 RepID=UPI000927FD57|nr:MULTISPECIES: copper homeostasis periplasmic binding protein CopC [unclassified Sphingomonas]MBN8849252.1 copper homeostasis periplasmic binding protein CopC [Sphingomonas sp.]OJV29207.1 MAG: copper resistance protein CopC [Sphingomonas sp. 67-36]